MKKSSILVTGAGSNCVVNTIKSLKVTGKYRLIATDINPYSTGAFRSDVGYLVPKESEDDLFIAKLLEICKKENVSLLIPGFDTEIPFIFKSKQRFEKIGVKVLIGNELLIKIGWDKYQLFKYLKENDLPYLKSFEIIKSDDALKELTFPLVVKPKSGWGQRGYHLINTYDEFQYVLASLESVSDNYMIQEYIDDNEGEYTNSVSVALDGDILGCICMKRELIKGSSIRMTIDEFPKVKKQMIEIAQKINSPGPINIQCRLRNGKAMVFEINSRFSTTNVVRAACGYNEVEMLVDNFLTGKKLFINTYQKKVAMAYLEYALVEPDQIKHFIEKGSTSAKAEINNWL